MSYCIFNSPIKNTRIYERARVKQNVFIKETNLLSFLSRKRIRSIVRNIDIEKVDCVSL